MERRWDPLCSIQDEAYSDGEIDDTGCSCNSIPRRDWASERTWNKKFFIIDEGFQKLTSIVSCVKYHCTLEECLKTSRAIENDWFNG